MPAMNNHYDLEERTFRFAKSVVLFSSCLPRSEANFTFFKQLIRSASSIGANYIEANESLGKKDRIMHIRIARKEAKETQFWLRLLKETNVSIDCSIDQIIDEVKELRLTLSKIINRLSE
jgi:four helix bundle protein